MSQTTTGSNTAPQYKVVVSVRPPKKSERIVHANFFDLVHHLRNNGPNGERGQHDLQGCRFGRFKLEQIGEQKDANVRLRFYRHPDGYIKVNGWAVKKVQGNTRNDNAIQTAFNSMKDDLRPYRMGKRR